MSSVIKERPAAAPGGDGGAAKKSAFRMTKPAASAKKAGIAIGASPWVDLLPPEVKERQRARSRLRMTAAVVAGIVAAVALGVTLVTFAANDAEAKLLEAKSTTATVLKQQASYVGAQAVADQITAIQTSRAFAVSTEIDWSTYLTAIESRLPADGSIDSATVDAPAAWEPVLAPADALRAPRVATITITAVTSTLADATEWVRALRDLPGYADSTTDSLEYSETDAAFKTVVTLNIDETARTGRFATEGGN